MKNKSFAIIGKVIFSLLIVTGGIYSINYLDFFNKLRNSLDFSQSGLFLGGGMYVHGFQSMFAYLGIVALIVLIVYYLDKFINKVSRKTSKR